MVFIKGHFYVHASLQIFIENLLSNHRQVHFGRSAHTLQEEHIMMTEQLQLAVVFLSRDLGGSRYWLIQRSS